MVKTERVDTLKSITSSTTNEPSTARDTNVLTADNHEVLFIMILRNLFYLKESIEHRT